MTPYYQDDAVTLYLGDCREVMPTITADVMVTDPPYGIAHSSNATGAPLRGEQIAGDSDTAVRDAVIAMWGNRPAVIFGTCKAPAPQVDVRGILVWDKGGHVGMGDLSFPWKQNWEHVYISGQGFSGRRGTGVLSFNAIPPWAGEITHPHQKPEPLLLELIAKCPLGVIVDPFAGSGTTLVAAKRLGRKAIGIELNEAYCEIAAKRLSQGALPLEFTA